jgi:hypothetical protein
MLELHHHVARVHLRVLHHLVGLVDLADADVGLARKSLPLVPRARLHDGLDLLARTDLLGMASRTNWSGLRETGRSRGGRWPCRSCAQSQGSVQPIVRSFLSRVSYTA